MIPLYVDSDCALGSFTGDVDDAFALAALLASDAPLSGVGAVFGNTREPLARRNLGRLLALAGRAPQVLRGADNRGSQGDTPASRWLASPGPRLRALALGPLTNLAAALGMPGSRARERIVEVIAVAGMLGPGPAQWDLNRRCDPGALDALVRSGIPVTLVPCDVARRLWIRPATLRQLPGQLGRRLASGSRRWIVRNALLLRWGFPVWDLVAAMYALEPHAFDTDEASDGTRRVKGFEPEMLWASFVERLARSHAGTTPPK